ncbi:hypothetical protein BD410DRAFT_820447 [Rickenella mellea]|uniref:Uncharacterized protein n=1 Tax=Rickenella mellea TaxID=50990 RepID=A0A4Y7Q9H0_9AGAM|nr:hypothetical protein BD410DRAFT_820447 [Rickenella mellea]
MGNPVTRWVFRRQKFCCCLPVRMGVIAMSALSVLLAGFFAVILWFEVATQNTTSSGERTVFIIAAIIETALFIASILGFIGACARKQLFVVIYAFFLYFHFLLNFGVAAYLLYHVTRAANTDIVKACQQGLRNDGSKNACKGLLNFTKELYWGLSSLVLAIEAYGAILITRYVNQLKDEKKKGRESRMALRQSAYEAYHKRFSTTTSETTIVGSDSESLLTKEYSPYEENSLPYSATSQDYDGKKSPPIYEADETVSDHTMVDHYPNAHRESAHHRPV